MKKKYKIEILTKLINKYENSIISKSETSRILKIRLQIFKEFKEYKKSDKYQETIAIDSAIDELLESELIIKGRYFNEDKKEIYLNIDSQIILEVYSILGKTNPQEKIIRTISFLNSYYSEIEYVNSFIKDIIYKLENHISVVNYFNIKDEDILKDILKVLEFLMKQTKEISFRKFSILLFNNSKKLDTLKSRTFNIIKDYYRSDIEYIEEAFEIFNVIKNPTYIYIKGNIVIKIHNQYIDLSKLASPFSITTGNLECMEIVSIDAKNIMTVENLTSFYDLELEDTLIIYLGGYHNTLRRKLLEMIENYNPKVFEYKHFGDIDAGGFYIYLHLKNKTKLPFKTFCMDVETLKKYQEYTQPLTKNDRNRLIKLKDIYNNPIIDYMLINNIKLEQEIIDI